MVKVKSAIRSVHPERGMLWPADNSSLLAWPPLQYDGRHEDLGSTPYHNPGGGRE